MFQRYAIPCALAALATSLLVLCGCAGTPHAVVHAQPDAHDALVLPPSTLMERHDDDPMMQGPVLRWEYGRNDTVINYRPYGAARPYGWSETYTRDRFYTFGGRVHDHSRFEIRSYRVR